MSNRYVQLTAYEFTRLKGIEEYTYGFTISNGVESAFCNSALMEDVLGTDARLLQLAEEAAEFDPRISEMLEEASESGMVINDAYYDEKEIRKMLASSK